MVVSKAASYQRRPCRSAVARARLSVAGPAGGSWQRTPRGSGWSRTWTSRSSD